MASIAAQKAAEAQADTDFADYADKPATDLHVRMARWVCDKTGYDPKAAKTKEQAFLDGIRLTKFLQSPFQASPENQAVLEERRLAKVEAAEAKAAEPKRSKAAETEESEESETPKPAAKPVRGRKAAKPAPAPEPEESEEEDGEPEEEAPKPTPIRGRRPAKRSRAAATSEAPF